MGHVGSSHRYPSSLALAHAYAAGRVLTHSTLLIPPFTGDSNVSSCMQAALNDGRYDEAAKLRDEYKRVLQAAPANNDQR